MNKSLEIIFILVFATFTFFLGVGYSDNIKETFGWMFEGNESQVALPDLSDTQNPEINVQNRNQ